MNLLIWQKQFSEELANQWRNLLKKITEEPLYRYLLLASSVFVLANWLLAWWLFQQSADKQLIIHYTTEFGANQISSPESVFIFPLIGTLIMLLNLTIAQSLKIQNIINVKLLLFAALVFNQIILSGLYSIYLINFR